MCGCWSGFSFLLGAGTGKASGGWLTRQREEFVQPWGLATGEPEQQGFVIHNAYPAPPHRGHLPAGRETFQGGPATYESGRARS